MKMNNKKSFSRQSQKKIVAMNMLLIICSGSYAEVPLTDHKLSEQTSDSKHLDAEIIQRAQNSMAQPIDQQKKESKALSDQNNQGIQKQNIDETALSDYQMQKKKAAEQLMLNERQASTDSTMRLFDTVNQSDNLRMNYYDGISIEMKR
jgi:septal ring factor EnvC (AmiA/AmiB activator)